VLVHVLVIGSYQLGMEAIRRGLEAEGFRVDVAPDSQDSWAAVCAENYDAVILDLPGAGGSGLGLLEHLRQVGLATPVLVLTGQADPSERARCLDLGADDCLARPFEFVELAARLRALARRHLPLRQQVLRIGDLEIDPGRHLVKRAGRVIDLTPREFSLLHYLAQHRGRVVSRAMIWHDVYKDTGDQSSNVVDVYIRYLRKKVDKGPGRPLILTRRGQGYLLRGPPGSPPAAEGGRP
jgi:two-component system OmpR family response regulator